EGREAALLLAQEFAGTAQLKIGLGDFEAVVGFFKDGEALAGFWIFGGSDEDAMRIVRATANAPAQLMELGEAETLGVLDEHDGGIGNVEADFDERRGEEDV